MLYTAKGKRRRSPPLRPSSGYDLPLEWPSGSFIYKSGRRIRRRMSLKSRNRQDKRSGRRTRYICISAEWLENKPLYFHWSTWGHRNGYPGRGYPSRSAISLKILPLIKSNLFLYLFVCRARYIKQNKKSMEGRPLYFHWSARGHRNGHPGPFYIIRSGERAGE